MGLDAEGRQRVEFGALLHDVGKIAIPKSIINKPGKLDDDEWAVMKTHTIEGQRMLERVGGLLGRVGLVVRASHERWDGGGYPDGLAGENIPLAARVVSIGDPAVIAATPIELANGRVASKAMDNRLGAYIVLEAARRVASEEASQWGVAAVAAAQDRFRWEHDAAVLVGAYAALRPRTTEAGSVPRATASGAV
jgi:hypothetical protein